MPYYEARVYDCEITGQGFSTSKNKQTPFLFLTFKPDGGEYERKIDLYITEKTVDRLVEWLGSVGVSIDKWSDLDPDTTNYQSMAGMTVALQCKHEPSQDGSKVYEKWELPMLPRALPPVQPMEKAGIRSLDRAFGAALKPLKSGSVQQAKPSPKSPPANRESVSQGVGTGAKVEPQGEDDIPF